MSTTDVGTRVKVCIIKALDLELTPDDIADDVLLLGPAEQGGLELDLRATLTVWAALSQEFDLTSSKITKEAFHSVGTLVDYVHTALQLAQPTSSEFDHEESL